MNTIYKICTGAAWEQAQAQNIYNGSDDDQRDGFIHFSTASQLQKTAEKHFAGRQDLVLLAVDGDVLRTHLKWEPSRGGALFPHLYAPMPVSAVINIWELSLDENGRHQFPQGLNE